MSFCDEKFSVPLGFSFMLSLDMVEVADEHPLEEIFCLCSLEMRI